MIIEIPSQVNTALQILSANGYEAYVVGGAVRNCLMGLTAADWDVTTSALPEQTKEAFSDYKVIETGIKHGTVTVIIDSFHVEITTFRVDGEYSDNRRPDFVKFTSSLTDDLSRRDFTCNAIAYSPLCGFKDPFGGMKDIESKLLRCVGEPDERFGEDALRILRALRFSRTLGFEIDPALSESIHKNVSLLSNISYERITAELFKTLPNASAAFLNEYSDVIFQIIPELKAEKGCEQNHERHIYDVWRHTCVSVENCPPDPGIRLAALLHDIGKPSCKTTDENGVDHFCGHEQAGAEIARAVLNRMKVSNAVKNKTLTLVEHHSMMPEKMSKKSLRKYIGSLGEETMRDIFALREADLKAQNPAFIDQTLKEAGEGVKNFEEALAGVKCFKITDLEVNGSELISEGIESGPALGKILSRLFDEVISDGLENKKDVLIKRAKEIYEDGNS